MGFRKTTGRQEKPIQSLPFPLAGFTVEGVKSEDGVVYIQARSTAQQAYCPNCQHPSVNAPGWYTRQAQDLPCIGQTVRLHLEVRRFRCLNKDGEQRTFVEQFPDTLPPYARRTKRLTQALRHLAFEVSAEGARRILRSFQSVVSGDTVLRISRQTPVTPVSSAHVIGVDDWALKKGRRYGTVGVDLEGPQGLEVLLERTSSTLEAWLKSQPQVDIVARDRSGEYAAGITAGAPAAIQVADRWHRLLNLRQMLERFLGSLYPRRQPLPMAAEDAALRREQRPPVPRTGSEQIASQQSRDRRIARYEHIQQLRQAGYNITPIGKQLGHHWETVRKYDAATTFPERNQRRAGDSL